MTNKFKLHLQWQKCSEVTRPAPLVVLLPWVWAERKYTAKYADLATRGGWDVLIASWPMQAMWFPFWAQQVAMDLIEALGATLASQGERPLVVWAFSGSAKGVFSSVLSILSGQCTLSPQQTAACTAILRCCCGVIYDSCPVDFTSETGKKLLAPAMYKNSSTNSNSCSSDLKSSICSAKQGTSPASSGGDSRSARAAAAARAAADSVAGWSVGVGAGVLDFFLLECFDRDREAMWRTLENPPLHGPFAFLYSRSDELADANRISQLANTLRQRGHCVVEQVWQDSPHCEHYRYHTLQYEESVSYFFSAALQYWLERRARLLEGRQLAARWNYDQTQTQQQEQQQQQQQLARQPARGSMGDGSGSWSTSSSDQQQQQTGAMSALMSGSRRLPSDRCHHARLLWHVHGNSQPVRQPVHSNRRQSCTEGDSRSYLSPTTSYCCSSDVLAAATVAAVADATHAAAAGLGSCIINHAKQQGHPSNASAPSKQRRCRPQSREQLDSSKVSAGGGKSWSADASPWSRSAVDAAAAVTETNTGSAGTPFISTCCGCQATECRCAETIAAANGEVVCSDVATLAHSLRCMVSSYRGWQQQQQKSLIWRQSCYQHQQHCYQKRQGRQEIDVTGCLGAQLQKTSSGSSSGDTRALDQCGDNNWLSSVWMQQHQGVHPHASQRVAIAVRSRL